MASYIVEKGDGVWELNYGITCCLRERERPRKGDNIMIELGVGKDQGR